MINLMVVNLPTLGAVITYATSRTSHLLEHTRTKWKHLWENNYKINSFVCSQSFTIYHYHLLISYLHSWHSEFRTLHTSKYSEVSPELPKTPVRWKCSNSRQSKFKQISVNIEMWQIILMDFFYWRLIRLKDSL